MEKLGECSICFQMFNYLDKKPKILSCGHTFCLSCLMSLDYVYSLTCPECRQNTTITGTPNELITNFGLQDVAEKTCGECFVYPWSEQCIHCQDNLCSNCNKNHKQQSLDEVIDILNNSREKVECMENNFHKSRDTHQIKDKCASVKSEVTRFWKEQLTEIEQKMTNDNYEMGKREKQLLLAHETWQKSCNTITKETKKQIWNFLEKIKQEITHKEILDLKDDVKGLVHTALDAYHHEPSVTDLNVNLSHKELGVYLAAVGVLGKSCIIGNTCTTNPREEVGQTLTATETLPRKHFPRRFIDQPQCWWLAALVPVVITLLLVAWTYRSPTCELNYSAATYVRSVGNKGTGPGEFNFPCHVAVSPITGNIFVTDIKNSYIHKFTKDFKFISMLTSSDTMDSIQLSKCGGIAINSKGKVFISQPRSHHILVLDENGKQLNTITLEDLESGKNFVPYTLNVDKNDNVYICDTLNYRIIVMTADGTFVRQFGEHGTGSGQFVSLPFCITVSVDELVAVSDADGHIYLFTTHGDHIRTIMAGQSGSFNDASGITFDTNGKLIVADFKDGKLYVITKEGELVATIGYPDDDKMPLISQYGVALTPDGYIIVCDRGNHQLHIFYIKNCSS